LEVKDGYSLLDSQVACPAELQVRPPVGRQGAKKSNRTLTLACLPEAFAALRL